ncbi:hypothetical protein [Algoriphagus aquimarinus]|uniref:Phosphate/sulfate permease n=1 Tax=Algoriphagus aquimarinus TaxID=237018 RepID=A0A1I0Y136_9BACT|nr:hypothetical protein [Algoriphagus aquimarinus]SFB06922.1 hypothetical protein SAMN04489723_10454 [Algoriphagus aquimarinus]
MHLQQVIPLIAFILATYSVIGNDVIQTLGTFLTSNHKKKWWVLWFYAGSILTIVLVYGWITHQGDVSYGRLNMIPLPENMPYWYIIPPIVLIILTRFGLPVSTTFMILSVFSSQAVIEKMILKSVLGYALAFVFAFAIYLLIAKRFESKESISRSEKDKAKKGWLVAQWLSTGLLWSQWLVQDFANLYVYLPRQLTLIELVTSLIIILVLMAHLFRSRGGKIQEIVHSKSNTQHIRSATFIDLTYAIVLFLFTELSSVPMSTTWVFIGILAGREIAISYRLNKNEIGNSRKQIFRDLYKVNIGLIVSILLAYAVGMLNVMEV